VNTYYIEGSYYTEHPFDTTVEASNVFDAETVASDWAEDNFESIDINVISIKEVNKTNG